MTDCACDMKGFLSFLILWIASKEPVTGAQIAQELSKRKGNKPSPGTIYPALKELKERGLLHADDKKRYSLTPKGHKELHKALHVFTTIFSDYAEMHSCCRKH